jgi:hypothetical protein
MLDLGQLVDTARCLVSLLIRYTKQIVITASDTCHGDRSAEKEQIMLIY